MAPLNIKNTIVNVFKENENFKNLELEENYLNLGISSLTIISLQIDVEEKLGINIGTRELMGFSTINQWIKIYTEKAACSWKQE
jgi:acyl carrier protein